MEASYGIGWNLIGGRKGLWEEDLQKTKKQKKKTITIDDWYVKVNKQLILQINTTPVRKRGHWGLTNDKHLFKFPFTRRPIPNFQCPLALDGLRNVTLILC